MSERYNVVQFFDNDTHEYVRRRVGAEDAMRATGHYTHSVAARIGMVRRVIITDDGDNTVWDWRFGDGIVFDSEEGAEAPAAWDLAANMQQYPGGKIL